MAKQLISAYEKYECSCMASIKVTKDEDYKKYGFASGKEVAPGVIDIESIIEKPGKEKAPSNLANVAGAVYTPNIFEYLSKAQELLGEGDELYYNDPLKLMLADGKRIMAVEVKGGKYYDTGTKLEYLKTVVEFGLKNEDMNGEFKEYLKGLKL